MEGDTNDGRGTWRWEEDLRDLSDRKKTSGASDERRSLPLKYGDLSTLVGIGWRSNAGIHLSLSVCRRSSFLFLYYIIPR